MQKNPQRLLYAIFDRFGNILTMQDALGQEESYTYSTLGRLESKTDRNGVVTSYGYDALGRVLETVTSVGDTLSYAYTQTGQVLWEQSNHQRTEYTYDELGRVVSVTETELSRVDIPVFFTLTLDPNGGELTGSDQYTVWSNDQITLPLPNRVGYGFEGWSTSPNGFPNSVSKILAELVAAGGSTEITLYAIWDSTPDVTVPTVPTFPSPEDGIYSLRGTGMNTYTKAYTYDLAGNRTSFVLTKDGETVHNIVYQYDALNRLTGVFQNGASAATYAYDSNGNRTRLTYGNGVTTTYAYNKANWVTSITGKKGSTTVTRYDYTYYASGNQRSVEDKDGVVTSYTYDGLGRLTQESETGGLTVAYTYDGAGNRTKMVVTGSETYTTTYTYDANNRLTQENKKAGNTTNSTVYTYDANGNLVKKRTPNGAEQYDYNGFDQLTVLKQGSAAMTYAYNASGIRTAKRTENSDTYFLLDGGDVVAEYTDGELTASYLRGINLISSTTSHTKYYLHNAHGDVVALANSSGTVTKRYDHDAFGNEENPSDSDTNPFRYCGEYFDTETQTYYLRARYYAPTIGRFTQQDTHWSSANAIYGDNPRKINERQDALGLTTYAYAPEITAIMQSGNLYVYCVNSPMVYRDSTGNAIAKSYDSGDNELAILIVAIVAISAGEIVYFAKQNHAKGSSGKIGGRTAVAGAPMPDPDDDDKNKKQGYLSKQELNRRKSQVLENKDIHFKTKEQALEFIEKKFPGFKQEIAKHRSSQGWHFDLHPINNSANPIEHINLYSKSGGFSIHITWG